MKKVLLIIFGCFFIFCSNTRNNNVIYYKSKIIDDFLWHKDSIYSFDFEIKDTGVYYNVYVDLRNNNNYPFSNIFLFFRIEFLDDYLEKYEIYRDDTLQYIMASPDGRWLGTGITNIKKNIFLYDSNIKFKKQGIYKIRVIQGMRVDKLEGLESLSLIIEKNI